ncbi:transcriptional regulator, AraC family [Burkholderia pseudomallei MSHR1000]|nr:transcriptional regulator, AraC family [Burkholderia pseudomallei MSHR1000]
MLFQSRSLEDVHDHGLAIAGWRQVYRQMTPGRFRGTVTQVLYDDFHFFRETTNRRVAQTGVSPEGRTSLAVPLLAPLSGTFQRQHVDGYALLALRPGEDFEFHTPEGMRLVGISAAPDMIEELCEAEFGTRGHRAPRHVTRLTHEQGAALGARLSSYIDDAQRNPTWLAYDGTRKMFRDAMLGVFLDALSGAVGEERRDITHATYSDIDACDVQRHRRALRALSARAPRRARDGARAVPRAALQPAHVANELPARGRRDARHVFAHDSPECRAPSAAHDIRRCVVRRRGGGALGLHAPRLFRARVSRPVRRAAVADASPVLSVVRAPLPP